MNSEIILERKIDFAKLVKQMEGVDYLVLIDQLVYETYSEEIESSGILSKAKAFWRERASEDLKNLDEYGRCIEMLLSKGVHRKCHLLAIGGGMITDFAGFVSATILRGISWSVVPTTLLGMVDAAIGGKVAVNSEHGKNLIGTFHLPESVFIFTDFVNTLSEPVLRGGQGEVIKYGLLSKRINDRIKNGVDLETIIQACADYKTEIVEEDFKESGRRKILNLGHTFGHGIELHYSIPHGVAVFWGTILMALILDKKTMLDECLALAEKLGWIDLETPWHNRVFPVEDIFKMIEKDKKKTNSSNIDVVVLDEVGSPVIENVSIQDLKNKIIDKENEIRKFTI